jgi:hypothetical protein
MEKKGRTRENEGERGRTRENEGERGRARRTRENEVGGMKKEEGGNHLSVFFFPILGSLLS